MGAVDRRRSGHPDLDVRTSRPKLLSYVQGLRAVEGPLRGYNDVLGGIGELWRAWLRIDSKGGRLRPDYQVPRA